MYMYMYVVWGELACCKRSLTHRPSSQGWASGVLLFVCVCMGMFVLRVCKGKRGELLFFLLFLLFLG